MSLVQPSLAEGIGHSSRTDTSPTKDHLHTKAVDATDAVEDKPEQIYSSQHEAYDEPIYDLCYDADDNDTMPPSPCKIEPILAVPVLPPKSALRTSNPLENMYLKMGSHPAVGPADTGYVVSHDVYLSSEEDASSSADDFSEYEYDSSTESYSHYSPSRRRSHEDTAKLVAVVFSGKPSIIELSARHRSVSPTSTHVLDRSSTFSSTRSPVDRPSTPSSSVSSLYPASRSSSLVADTAGKSKPLFLSVDPYASGTSYSLDLVFQDKVQRPDAESPIKQPKTPTQMVKDITRTFSLVKKRSRPFLHAATSSQLPPQRVDTASRLTRSSVFQSVLDEEAEKAHEKSVPEQPLTPMSPPMTYEDIMRTAKLNATYASHNSAQTPQQQIRSQSLSVQLPPTPVSPSSSPIFPAPGARNGLLSGFAARRRSMRLTGRVVL